MREVTRALANGPLMGSANGRWVKKRSQGKKDRRNTYPPHPHPRRMAGQGIGGGDGGNEHAAAARVYMAAVRAGADPATAQRLSRNVLVLQGIPEPRASELAREARLAAPDGPVVGSGADGGEGAAAPWGQAYRPEADHADVCDRCQYRTYDLDAGFCVTLQGMTHGGERQDGGPCAGGTFRRVVEAGPVPPIPR